MKFGLDLLAHLKFDRDCLPTSFVSLWVIPHRNQFPSPFAPLHFVSAAVLFEGHGFRLDHCTWESTSTAISVAAINFSGD
jgi:hypothetical protein